MKRLLLSTMLAAGLTSSAYATNIDVISYSTPDGPEAFYSVTTTLAGDFDTPYSYYTGPIVFQLSTGKSIVVYCTDLEHWLQVPTTYAYGPLLLTGQGNPIPTQVSYEIGWIAQTGAAALLAGEKSGLPAVQKELDFDMAAAAQSLIWDFEYPAATTTFAATTDGSQIEADWGILFDDALALPISKGNQPALAIQPFDEDWWVNGSASQQMVVASVPEPSTWAMMLAGFAGLGYAAWRRTSKGPISAIA